MRRARTVLLVLTLLAVGCGAPSDDAATDVEADAPAEVDDRSFEHQHEAAEHVHTWATLITPALDEHADLGGEVHTKAVELLSTLDLLLRERITLIAATAQTSAAQDERGAEAVRRRIDANTEDLSRTFADTLSGRAAEDFATHWRSRTHGFMNLAEAIAADDHDAERRAHEEAEEAAEELVDWAGDATAGAIARDELEHEFRLELRRVAAVADATVDDTEDRYELLLRALHQTTTIAEILADGAAADGRLEGDVRAEVVHVHTALAGAMEDHVLLLTTATRVALDTEEIPTGADRALDEATNALTEVIERTLGQGAATEIDDLWARHTVLLLDHADASRRGDERERAELRDQLDAWSTELGEALERATEGALDAATMEREAAGHVDTVITTIEAQIEAVGA